jgi:hypothetical protein
MYVDLYKVTWIGPNECPPPPKSETFFGWSNWQAHLDSESKASKETKKVVIEVLT